MAEERAKDRSDWPLFEQGYTIGKSLVAQLVALGGANGVKIALGALTGVVHALEELGNGDVAEIALRDAIKNRAAKTPPGATVN